MKVAAISVNKGGVGKTTLTKSLATAAVAAGHLVLILDMDTQQNSTNWGRRRADLKDREFPIVWFSTINDLDRHLEKARKNGCELVIIDTPPGRSEEALAALDVADLVLIPFVADDVDSFDGVARTARVASKAESRPRTVGLVNCVTPGSSSQQETAKAITDSIGIELAPVILHRFTAHRDANPRGLTALESEPDSKAAAEISALWEWFRAQLQIGTRARVQKGAA